MRCWLFFLVVVVGALGVSCQKAGPTKRTLGQLTKGLGGVLKLTPPKKGGPWRGASKNGAWEIEVRGTKEQVRHVKLYLRLHKKPFVKPNHAFAKLLLANALARAEARVKVMRDLAVLSDLLTPGSKETLRIRKTVKSQKTSISILCDQPPASCMLDIDYGFK